MPATARPPKPTIPYTALVGQVLLRHRGRLGLQQSELAEALNASQPAYSRIEQGDTTLSISQLRAIAHRLGMRPGEILREADSLADQLRAQGVDVTGEKGVNPAAIMIGLGILAALLASK
jgi:transcriptional regulator with XRE-family HTH domain